jgi:diguanylate cyclase (GGDEF)-like protein
MSQPLLPRDRSAPRDRSLPEPLPAPRLPIALGHVDGVQACLLTVGALLAVVLTALLDYETGPALSLCIFYLVPVAVCAWWCGFSHGILLSLAGAVAWSVVDSLENPSFPAVVGLWNGIVRFGMLVIISSLVARLHTGVQRERTLARTDALTGAANGRTFYETVIAESERALRNGRPLTLAYLDLDNFKQLNDQLGHAAGDAALVDLVQLIRPGLRAHDVLARLGGDEFALLLPETDGAGAVALLTRLQTVIGQEMNRAGRSLTVSVGAVTFCKPLWDVDVMVQQVDTLMYAAKRFGKNRVEHATVSDVGGLAQSDRLRLERRATARNVCDNSARVRREGAESADEEFATIHDISPDGVGLRMDRQFPVGSILIVEPLAHQASTLLARVVRAIEEPNGWLHGCELPARLSSDEMQRWVTADLKELPL